MQLVANLLRAYIEQSAAHHDFSAIQLKLEVSGQTVHVYSPSCRV